MTEKQTAYTNPVTLISSGNSPLERELKELECDYYLAIRKNEPFAVIKEYYSRIKQLRAAIGA